MRNRRKPTNPDPRLAVNIQSHASAALVALRLGDADEVERRLLLIHSYAGAIETSSAGRDDWANLANIAYGTRF